MAYHIEIEDPVLDYLCHEDRNLSADDVEAIVRFLGSLAGIDESFRDSRRPSPGAPHFEVDGIFLDSSGKLRQFRFIITDASAVYGVLRVCFVEELWEPSE